MKKLALALALLTTASSLEATPLFHKHHKHAKKAKPSKKAKK